MLNLSVIAALCLSNPSVQWPAVTAVQSEINGQSSRLVRVTPAGIEAFSDITPFVHATGWSPLVTINDEQNQALVVLVPPLSRHGETADLYLLDLVTGHRRLVARRVEPRQKALFTPHGPLYVTVENGERIINVGDRQILRAAAAMWWPLHLRDNKIYALVYADRMMKMIRLDLSSAKSRIIRNWKSTPVRDFHFHGRQVVYQSQPAFDRFSVEVLDLVSNQNRVVHQSNRPWLTPMFIDGGILFAETLSAVAGSLKVLSGHLLTDGPELGSGAPIPIAKHKDFVVFRLQQKAQQTYLIWHQKTNRVARLPVGGDSKYLLESIQFQGGNKQ